MRASGCIIGCKAAGKPLEKITPSLRGTVNSGVAELKYAGPILKSERGRQREGEEEGVREGERGREKQTFMNKHSRIVSV
jgi:hypothetical protein